jgi:hypothetical protein
VNVAVLVIAPFPGEGTLVMPTSVARRLVGVEGGVLSSGTSTTSGTVNGEIWLLIE